MRMTDACEPGCKCRCDHERKARVHHHETGHDHVEVVLWCKYMKD